MLIIPFWYGLFYEYTAFFAGIIFLILFLKITYNQKKIILKKSKNFYIYVAIIISYLIVSIWAIDKEFAFEGFLKFLPGIFYFILLMQFEKEDKQKLIDIIPTSGAAMCVISYVLGQIPVIRAQFFSDNGRLVGFFQYSNSFALFLLIGIITLFNKKEKIRRDKVIMLVLIIGLLLTGSRTIFIFAILYGIYQIIKNRKNKKNILLSIGIILIGILISLLLFGITNNIDILKRLFQISLQESTLIGRIIYYIDGLKIIVKNPFGLGYMGYSYIYPQIQTADYTVKFIHNDFLQQALDTGIVPMIMLIYLFICNIWDKKSSSYKKEILVIMMLHMMLEFDMQFLAIHLIFVMLLEDIEAKTVQFKIKNTKIALMLLTVTQMCILGYFGIASIADKYGNYELALELLPNKTSSNIQKIVNIENIEEAEELANKILEKNKYVSVAYKVKANYAYYIGDEKQLVENLQKSINLNKYDIQEYEDYIFLIGNSLEQTITQEDNVQTAYLIEEALKVKELMEKTIQNTNPLAYKTVDKPKLELSQDIKQYLETLRDYQKNMNGG